MPTRLSAGPLQVTSLDLTSVNYMLQQVRRELDEIKGLRGTSVIHNNLTVVGEVTSNTVITHPTLPAAGLNWIDSGHTYSGSSEVVAGFAASTHVAKIFGVTGTAGSVVLSNSPTILTPTIASFVNATHTHQNAAGGGTLDHGLALTGLADDDHSAYLLASSATSRAFFAASWTDLTDGGASTLHSHAAGAGTIIGAGTDNQVAIWNGTGAIDAFNATAGSVFFAGASGILAQDNASLFFDDSSNELGVGTASPSGTLHVQSATVNKELLILNNTNVTSGASVPFFMSSMSGGSQTNVSFENGGAGEFVIRTGATDLMGYGSIRQKLKINGDVALGGSISGTFNSLADAVLVLKGLQLGLNVGSGTFSQNVEFRNASANDGMILYNTSLTTDGSTPIFITGTNGTSNVSNVSLEFLTRSSTTAGDLIIRTGATSAAGFGSIALGLTGNKQNLVIGGYNTTQPGTGTLGLIFNDGTALSSMASNTAGLYADDVGGTVSMHAIHEDGKITDLATLHSTGTASTFVGVGAGNLTHSVGYNTGVGTGVLAALTEGFFNTMMGRLAGSSLTSGDKNAGFGTNALIQLTTGNRNVAIGADTLGSLVSGSGFIAIGTNALTGAVSGTDNVAIGDTAANGLTTGSYNTAIGALCMQSGAMVGALANTGCGRNSLGVLAEADFNSALGYNSLSGVTTGDSNTGVGDRAGVVITTGSNNIFLGALADSSSATLTNAGAIGANAIVGSSNHIMLGDSAVCVGIAGAARPTGSGGLIFPDGTILSSMASNTAGLYANDVGGTVNMFAINEAGTVTQLTGGFDGTVTPVTSITVVNGFVTAVS